MIRETVWGFVRGLALGATLAIAFVLLLAFGMVAA
jgi:hypothetical protein